MRSISYTAACADLPTIMQKVCQDRVPVIITRSKAEPVVIISLSDFEAMQGTNYLMQSPVNARRLLEGMGEVENSIAKQSLRYNPPL